MNVQRSIVFTLALAFFSIATIGMLNGQEGEEKLKRYVNQLEAKYHKITAQKKEIDGALEKTNRKEHPEKYAELRAHQKELNNALAEIKNQFAKIRQRNQRREGDREKRAQQERDQSLENKYRQYAGQLKEINAWLERNRGDDYPEKRKQLLAKRKAAMNAMAEIKAHFARIKDRERGERESKQEREGEHPEIRTARNQLRHLRQAHGHLREAGMDEIATMVGQRIEKIQAAIARYERSRRTRERDSDRRERASDRRERDSDRRERDSDRRERDSDRRERESRDRSDDNFRKEVSGAIRELSSAIRSLRKEVEELKKRRR